MTDDQTMAATPHAELIAELMNPNNPKNDREHAAVREIERLREAFPTCGHTSPELYQFADADDEPEQEPVAWFHLHNCEAHFTTEPSEDMVGNYWTPLYTSPPKRQPLTDAEILTKIICTPKENRHYLIFARSIEQAHGIGDKT